MRLRPTPREVVVLGARIGPSRSPPRSVSSVLPVEAGNDETLAVARGWEGGESVPPLPQPAAASASSATGATVRGCGTRRTVGSVVQSAINPERAGGSGMAERAAIVTGASSGIGLAL